ncbi:MAG: hypothetical protein GTO14_10825, partial [Anaerolineales bacterium]|nr:hypothetical protein [Anaerolineales bacterium]
MSTILLGLLVVLAPFFLAGGALAIYLRRRAARRKAPPSTMACIHIILHKLAESPFVGSLEEAYFQLKPAEALAIVQLTKLLDGDPDILDGIRQHHALPIQESQTSEGHFEQFTYWRLDGGGPGLRSPAPGTYRHDGRLYDIPITVEIIELFKELDVPIKD